MPRVFTPKCPVRMIRTDKYMVKGSEGILLAASNGRALVRWNKAKIRADMNKETIHDIVDLEPIPKEDDPNWAFRMRRGL